MATSYSPGRTNDPRVAAPLAILNVYRAWELLTRYGFGLGSGIKVGVVGYGYKTNAEMPIPDPANCYNYDDGSSNVEVSVTAIYGEIHDARVASIVFAKRGNASFGCGIAPDATPVIVKTGTSSTTNSTRISDAIVKAKQFGAQVVCCSMGATLASSGEVAAAADGSCFVLQSAGNSSEVWSSAPTNVWLIGGSDNTNPRVRSTVAGDTGETGSAYGAGVCATAPMQHYVSPIINGGFTTDANGTSFACPAVGAIAALVWCVRPAWDAATVKGIISSTWWRPAGWTSEFPNAGLVDAGAAVEKALRLAGYITKPSVDVRLPAGIWPGTDGLFVLSSPLVVQDSPPGALGLVKVLAGSTEVYSGAPSQYATASAQPASVPMAVRGWLSGRSPPQAPDVSVNYSDAWIGDRGATVVDQGGGAFLLTASVFRGAWDYADAGLLFASVASPASVASFSMVGSSSPLITVALTGVPDSGVIVTFGNNDSGAGDATTYSVWVGSDVDALYADTYPAPIDLPGTLPAKALPATWTVNAPSAGLYQFAFDATAAADSVLELLVDGVVAATLTVPSGTNRSLPYTLPFTLG